MLLSGSFQGENCNVLAVCRSGVFHVRVLPVDYVVRVVLVRDLGGLVGKGAFRKREKETQQLRMVAEKLGYDSIPIRCAKSESKSASVLVRKPQP